MTPSGPVVWHRAANAAVAAIAVRLGPRGQWPGRAYADADPTGSGRRDIAAPLTALGMLAAKDLPLPGVPDLLDRSRKHLESTVLPGGLWRYYANIPPDTDDSAMCALALGPHHPAVAGITSITLATTRLADGLFPTWFEPGMAPVIDPVPNAHVVAVIGPGPVTDVAIKWLNGVVADGREVAESAYYLDALDIHAALIRAVDAGVEALRPAVALARGRARARLATHGMSAYRTAQAMVVEAHGARPDAGVLGAAADHLVGLRRGRELWPSDTLFVAGNTEAPGRWHYQSEAVVTAFCARALVAAVRAVEVP